MSDDVELRVSDERLVTAPDGLSFDHPDCRFYKDGHRNPVRYPGGMTSEQWLAGPARSSALNAADLPED